MTGIFSDEDLCIGKGSECGNGSDVLMRQIVYEM